VNARVTTTDWSALAEILMPELAAFISQASGSLEALLGPPRERPLLGGGEVDGYAGLARRGHYERLLLSEWLLAEEMPDEFARRASANELAFHAIAKREPQGKRTLLVLLDAGPEQIGAPRLGHIAALVTLDRRARRLGATLAWAIVNDEATVHTTADEDGFRGFVRAHTDRSPTAESVAETYAAASEYAPFSEVFLVGGRSLHAHRLPGDTTLLAVDELFDAERRALTFRVTRGGRHSRLATVDLPDDATAVRMLRRPFEKAKRASDVRESANFDLSRGLHLSWNGAHLLGLSPSGDAIILGTGGASLDGKRKRMVVRRPEGETFIGVGFERQAPITIARTADELILRVGKQTHTCRGRTRPTLEKRLGRVLRFGIGRDLSLVLFTDDGTYRLEECDRRVVLDDIASQVGFGLLREHNGQRTRRRARNASVIVERHGSSVHVRQNNLSSPQAPLVLENVRGNVAVHVAVDPSRSSVCVVIHERESGVARSLIVPSALSLPPDSPFRAAHFATEHDTLRGVVATRAGFAFVVTPSPREIALETLDGKRRTAFRSESPIQGLALAASTPIAAFSTAAGIRVMDLDLNRVLTTVGNESP
jgi:hypothetical protein